jgi:hypothetical protein
VNFEKKAAAKKKKIYVLQHSTLSYRDSQKNGESFYFRYRFQKRLQVGGFYQIE